uniref:Peptidyl-prolyl cis-trans isomerase n=1 Tax=Aplanochytrium stocchinoi TaxID=215587 RepID=A0A7S3PA73_9STRA|mmetsp:Transcript_20419/g.24734  ORF Transcript_20419/g.24734 Transcript_20419/m.24734 type:complete len:185 (-) Transcript_20419:238-792(-)
MAASKEVWSVRFVVQLSEKERSDFVVEVHPEWAPVGVNRFRDLIDCNYFVGCRIYRVIPGFVAQFGIPADPAEWTKWGARKIKDDNPVQGNNKGYMSFATSGPNARGSQIFINLIDNRESLDSQNMFAPFAKVTSGMDSCVDRFYSGYTERNQKPDQLSAKEYGNEYFQQKFPLLSYIVSTEIL